MGQHMEHTADRRTVSDLGYVSHTSVYSAADCSRCPLRGMCYTGRRDRRSMEVNHRANSYRSAAKALLTSERGLMHRSNRPIEPEACFGNIKFNHGFKRFRLRSTRKRRWNGGWCLWRITSGSMLLIKQSPSTSRLKVWHLLLKTGNEVSCVVAGRLRQSVAAAAS